MLTVGLIWRNTDKLVKINSSFLSGDVNESKHKKAHTLNVEKEDAENEGGEADSADKEADAYQHVKQAKHDDLQVRET